MGVAKYRLTKTKDGGFQFSVYGPSGRAIATSETYRSKPAALNAIETLRKTASAGVVDDQTPGRTSSPNTPVPVAKAARAAGRAVGKAKAAVKEVLAPAKKKPTGQANGRATTGATKKPAARKTTAKAAPAKRTAAKAAPAKRTAAKAAPARKTTAKAAPARKTAAKASTPRKAAVKKTAAARRSGR